MLSEATRKLVQKRLLAETGGLKKQAPLAVCLAYPSPYAVAMSSLGFQSVYGAINEHPGAACERAFLPDDGVHGASLERPVTYESLRELGDFQLVAFSVAYELELAGLIRMLEASGLPALREERSQTAPLVLAGGPLTFSNPEPLAPFVDAIVLGEAEDVIGPVLDAVQAAGERGAAISALADLPSVWVPAVHGDWMPELAVCDNARLPAMSRIVTPHTELSSMFLIEAERGCSRGCTYCVMRRTTNGGMRAVPKERLLASIPADVRRVGLVGAAVSDHPQIVDVLKALASAGHEVGLSSLRPDRLKEPLVEALRLVGYRTLTTALDGASERLRQGIERRGRTPHYRQAAELARHFGMSRLKLYLMVGLPGETDDDIDECAAFVSELSRIVPVALGISPFCSKRRTPLDRMPYAGVSVVQSRLKRLRKGVRGRVEVRATSARWAWVEHVLAQGGPSEGHAAYEAVLAGGDYHDYQGAFARLGHSPRGDGYANAVLPPSPEALKRSKRAGSLVLP